MVRGVPPVDLGIVQDAGALVIGERPTHLRGDAGDERPVRDLGSLEHDGSAGDEAAGADDRAR